MRLTAYRRDTQYRNKFSRKQAVIMAVEKTKEYERIESNKRLRGF